VSPLWRQANESGLGVGDLAGKVGFAFAFALGHELPDVSSFFAEMARALVKSLFLCNPHAE